MTKKLILLPVFTLLVYVAGCEDFTIPSSDSTPPSALLDAHFTELGKTFITVTNTSSPATTRVPGNEEVSLVAKGTDNDGGCRDIQIWVETTAWRDNPDGTRTQVGPGLLGTPMASNPDRNASKPGDLASKERLISHKLDIRQIRGSYSAISLKVWATALNFHSGQSTTANLTIEWP